MNAQHTPAPTGLGADLDHVSFAVHDGLAWATRLRETLGATPIIGEAMPDFRYLLLYIGTAERGGRFELIDPAADGFLTRYLAKRDEGPHHLTFTVPDLEVAVAAARELGLNVVGEEYDHAPWREAFISPDRVHGVVIQLAQSNRSYPAPAELLATQERNIDELPSPKSATDPEWWAPLWEVAAPTQAELSATLLQTTNLEFSRTLFEGLLSGTAHHETDERIRFDWPGGSLRVELTDGRPGIAALQFSGSSPEALAGLGIGPVPFTAAP